MIEKRNVILTGQLVITLCFLTLSLSLSQAGVTLTVGSGSGAPGSSENPVAVSLKNLDDKVKGVQVEICDVDDYLSCTECTATGRASGFDCLFNELEENGCCRVFLFYLGSDVPPPLIEEGEGIIFTVKYHVSEIAPIGECRDLNPENVKISDEYGDPFPSSYITSQSGTFCFDSVMTTTTTIIDTSTTTIITNSTTTTTITDTSTTTTITDTSTTTTTTPDISIEVTPTEVKRSRWIPLFWLMYIKGAGTNFAIFKTPVVYDSKSVLKLPALVLSPTDIYQIILIMPSILTGIGFEGESETVTVTVEGVSDTFEIKMLSSPFDEENNLM